MSGYDIHPKEPTKRTMAMRLERLMAKRDKEINRKPIPPRHVETYGGYDIVYEKGKYVVFQNGLALEWSYSRGSAKDWINIQLRKINDNIKQRDWLRV
jgi:hypothetical protein